MEQENSLNKPVRRKRKAKKRDEDSDYPNYKGVSMYMILGCGLIIILIGLYLTVFNQYASGTSLPGRSGQGGGNTQTIKGRDAIIIGIGFSIFTAYQLLKEKKNKKKQDAKKLES